MPVIAGLASTSHDRVREMIHHFNELGMASLDCWWAGGRPRRVTTDDEEFVVKTATAGRETLGLAFMRWGRRQLAAFLHNGTERQVHVSMSGCANYCTPTTSVINGPRPARSPTTPTAELSLPALRRSCTYIPAVVRVQLVRAVSDPAHSRHRYSATVISWLPPTPDGPRVGQLIQIRAHQPVDQLDGQYVEQPERYRLRVRSARC